MSHRCRMGARRADAAPSPDDGTPSAMASSPRRRCNSLRAAHRHSLAALAARVPALAHRPSLVSAPLPSGHVRAACPCSRHGRPRASRPGGEPVGGGDRCTSRPFRRCRRGTTGYDPARRVVGRKRHVLTDTDGRLLLATVSPADLHDSHAGVALLKASRRPWPFLAMCFADRAYTGERVAGATPVTVAIVSAPEGQKGFAVHPRRWVVDPSTGSG